MTHPALLLAVVILGLFAVDNLVLDGDWTLYALRRFLALVETLAFWR